MTKTCLKCKKELPTSEFYKQQQWNKAKTTKWPYFDSICKLCRINYSYIRRREIKQKCIDFLGGKCIDCGLIDSQEVYDFHHLDPTKKEFSPSQKGGLSFEKMKKEIEKCVLLCANCHRKRHKIV